MKRFALLVLLLTLVSVNGYAEPDYFLGDTSVYAGDSETVRPNIMFLIDNSGAMKDLGSVEPYDPTIEYEGTYPREQVYLRNVANENNTNYQEQKFVVDEIECSKITDSSGDYAEDVFAGVGGTYQEDFPNGDGYDDNTGLIHPRFALEQNGFWYGALDSKGTCPNNENQWENYFTGNFRNYLENSREATTWEAWRDAGIEEDPASYELGAIVDPPDYDILFKCIEITGPPGDEEPDWNPDPDVDSPVPGTIVSDGDVKWEAMGTVLDMVQYQMEEVVFEQVRDRAKMGLMTFGDNNHGGAIIEPVLSAGNNDINGDTNLTSLKEGLASLDDLVNGNTQPVNESFWDAYLYWIGQSGSSDGIASDKVSYPSPIEYWCQSNHLVVLTTGSAGNNSQTKTKVGDKDGDGEEGLVDDVAKLMYEDLPLDIEGYQPKVQTHIIQLMTPYVQRLERATDQSHGRGEYRRIENPEELINALLDILTGILEAESSFVAPVVPASPETQLYSGERIYLGFFKPMNDEPWYGNIKKFALNADNSMQGYDENGDLVAATDSDGDFVTDTGGDPAVKSFWSDSVDGGLVDAGGVGAELFGLFDNVTPTVPEDRRIYFGDNLTQFTSTNVSSSELGTTTDAEAQSLIEYIYGLDAYSEFNNNGMRHWIKGDVMHSKPVIMNYASYDFNATNEADCTTNKTYIYVGGNDGMLHAYRDCNGSEAWAFIPQELVPDLKFLRDFDKHHYFVDGSPVIYFHDQDNDGNIEPDSELDPDTGEQLGNDKVILLFGMRRGGGNSTLSEDGSGNATTNDHSTYYALNVTDPENPSFLWKFNGDDVDFAELGQTWSLPTLARVNVGGTSKIVAVIGAGYDTNEDLRYGSTQDFPDAAEGTNTSSIDNTGEGDVVSASGSGPHAPCGRGVYIVEVASFDDDGNLSISNSVSSPIKSFTADNYDMSYSFPSDPLTLDRNSDGYMDTIYIGDSGGQLWRLDLGSTSMNDWDATRIFKANSSAQTDVGRKIFYKPTATVSGMDTFVFFGTGDREHPLNKNVIDRFYMIRDRRMPEGIEDDETTALNEVQEFKNEHNILDYTSSLNEGDLVDITDYDYETGVETDVDKINQLQPPYSDGTTTKYGWYMRFDETNHEGEKVLASARVFNGVVYFTTYQPTAPTEADDPCVGVLGPARLYAMNAFTGEATFNLNGEVDTNADGESELIHTDRYYEIGRGIASEPIVKVDKGGDISVLIGRGGGFFNSADNPDVNLGTMDPLQKVYWMKW